MRDEMQRPLKVSIAEWLLVAALALMSPLAFGQEFALQPGSHDTRKLDAPRDGRLITVAQLNIPGIDGMTVRGRRWDREEEPWDLIPFLDSCQATVRKAGDQWTLLICSGDDEDFTSEASLLVWEGLIAELGKRYASDTSLWGVHLTGCSPLGVSEERHHKITPAIEMADRRLMRAWAKAFPKQKLLFAIGSDPPGMKRLIKYLVELAPGRAVVKSNAMKSGTKIDAPHNQLIVWAAQIGAEIGFEMARADSNWSRVRSNIRAIEQQARKKISYLAPYPPDLARAGVK